MSPLRLCVVVVVDVVTALLTAGNMGTAVLVDCAVLVEELVVDVVVVVGTVLRTAAIDADDGILGRVGNVGGIEREGTALLLGKDVVL